LWTWRARGERDETLWGTARMRLYRTLVADPPWRYTQAASNKRGQPTYPTMTLGQLVQLPIHELADDDAHLYLWVTNAMMEHGHRLARAWGFTVFNIGTWCKPGPGVGHYFRTNTEHFLFCSRGRAATPDDKIMSTWFQWPRTPHSVKPDAFFDMVEQASEGPYVELFARRRRLGWDAWGNEVDSDVEMAA
jgi:N6-adenosine-specific RNA methylase IME4